MVVAVEDVEGDPGVVEHEADGFLAVLARAAFDQPILNLGARVGCCEAEMPVESLEQVRRAADISHEAIVMGKLVR